MALGKKTGGRKKGTPDARRRLMMASLAGYDPMTELIKGYWYLDTLTGQNPMAIQAQKNEINKILIPYVHPRIAQQVVQHNINTDISDVKKARESVLKIMARLRDAT